MSAKLSEKSEMSDVAEASVLVRSVVSVDAGATVMNRINRTARKLGWPYSRTRDVWYEQARRIDAHEMAQLQAAKLGRQIHEARKAYAELTQIIVGMEEALLRIDPDHYGEAVAGLRHSRGATEAGLGGVARAGDIPRTGGARR